MSRQTRNLWSGGVVLGCAVVALNGISMPDAAPGNAQATAVRASATPDAAPRFIMNPFLQTNNPEQQLLKDWLDIHQRMASPVKYSNSNSPLQRDPRAKGC
jgi:hypothetical protein